MKALNGSWVLCLLCISTNALLRPSLSKCSISARKCSLGPSDSDAKLQDITIANSTIIEAAIEKSWWLDSNLLQKWNENVSLPNLIVGAVLGVFLTIGSIVGPFFLPDDIQSSYFQVQASDSNSVEKPILLFEDILTDLKQGYVDEINTNRLFETAMTAMLKSLDPYTEFENLGAAKSIQESVSGKYGGVGMIIAGAKPQDLTQSEDKQPPATSPDSSKAVKSKAAGVVVVDAFEGYSFDSDVRVGDRLLSIDGIDTTAKNVEEVRDLLRGDPGTDVVVELGKDGPGKSDTSAVSEKVTIKRQLVQMSDVRLATFLGPPSDGIGYITLSGFNAGAAKDFRTAMLMLRFSAPHDLKGLVVDLRGNPGGLLDAAVTISSYLLPPDSTVVSAKGKGNVEPEIVYKSSATSIRPPGMKLALLVNQGSASASEIVSGAVQDYDAGVIVGASKTYGKGLVQKIVPLPYDNALKFTIAKYYTPSGRCIQAVNYLGGRSTPEELKLARGGAAEVSPLQGIKGVPLKEQESGDEDEPVGVNGKVFDDGSEGRTVSERDRKVFFTKAGRPVRDGGGIDPDIKVAPIKLGPSEQAFVEQNVYSDFASSYLRTHDVRPLMKAITTAERAARIADPRFGGGAFGTSVGQFLVLPTAYDVNGAEYQQYSPPTEALSSPKVSSSSFSPSPSSPLTSSSSSSSSSSLPLQETVPGDDGFDRPAFARAGVTAPFRDTFSEVWEYKTQTQPRKESSGSSAAKLTRDGRESGVGVVRSPELDQWMPFVMKGAAAAAPESSNLNDKLALISPDEAAQGGERGGVEVSESEIPLEGIITKSSTFTKSKSASSFSLASASRKGSMLNKAIAGKAGENKGEGSAVGSTAPSAWEKELILVAQGGADAEAPRAGRGIAAAVRSRDPAHAALDGDTLYAAFQQYVQARLQARTLSLESSLGKLTSDLEAAMRERGLGSVADEVKALQPRIATAVVADMDAHRASIVDSLELALLSREVPDRLLLYKSILADPQVEVAKNVLTGRRLEGKVPDVDVGEKVPDKIKNDKRGRDGNGKDLDLPPLGIEADLATSTTGGGSSEVDGEAIVDFAGVYEAILKAGARPGLTASASSSSTSIGGSLPGQ